MTTAAKSFSIFSKNTAPSSASSSSSNDGSDKSVYLSAGRFPYKRLMGDWTIIGSSLTLWKNRSDVTCQYTPHVLPTKDEEAGTLEFSDEIWYEQLDATTGLHQPGKGAPRHLQSMIRGRNRLDTSGANQWVSSEISSFQRYDKFPNAFSLLPPAHPSSGEATGC